MDIEENIYKGYKSGAVDYLRKPVVPELLRAKVGAFVDLSLKNKRLIAQEETLRSINQDLQREITERKLSEKRVKALNRDLKEKLDELQSLDAFAYSVSHDLMSPLNNINGLTNILIRQHSNDLNPSGQKMLQMVLESTQKMSKLIKNLLLFSRQANAELVKAELNMNEMVQAVLSEISAYKPIDHFTIEVQELPNANCDENMIRQVWINFISNAIKYSQKSENPHIVVGAKMEGGSPVYYVQDNGAGFDMKDYDKLFGAFQRLHTEKEFEGTGIGLNIVKRIVERHNGRVWAESVPGQGATFFFTLDKKYEMAKLQVV